MKKTLFSMLQGMRRIAVHPWLSLVFFCALISIGVILGMIIGQDASMQEPDVLPYANIDQIFKLITEDETARDIILSAFHEQICKRCMIVEQDVQCFSDTSSMLLRTQTISDDESGMLNQIQLNHDEAGMNRKTLHKWGLHNGERLLIDGKAFVIKLLPFNFESGVDVILRDYIPNGIHTYIMVMSLYDGLSPDDFSNTLASAWNMDFSIHSPDALIRYESLPAYVLFQIETIQAYTLRNLAIGILGALFAVSQISALMSYLIAKSRKRNMLVLQWTGKTGLFLEFGTMLVMLVLPSLPMGFLLGSHLENSVAGGSPALQDAGATASMAAGYTFIILCVLLMVMARKVFLNTVSSTLKGEDS